MKKELYDSAVKIKHQIENCQFEIKRLQVLKTADEITISGKGDDEFRRYSTILNFVNLKNDSISNKMFIEFVDKLIKIQDEILVKAQKEFDNL